MVQAVAVQHVRLMAALDPSASVAVDGRLLLHSMQNWLTHMLVAAPISHRALVLQTMYSLALASGACQCTNRESSVSLQTPLFCRFAIPFCEVDVSVIPFR